jgi:hypothetical protein
MAYVIGVLTPEEEQELRRRGWFLEDPPTELVPVEKGVPLNTKMVWIDNTMFNIMSGPDWDTK